jgi:hypothetical protein
MLDHCRVNIIPDSCYQRTLQSVIERRDEKGIKHFLLKEAGVKLNCVQHHALFHFKSPAIKMAGKPNPASFHHLSHRINIQQWFRFYVLLLKTKQKRA